MGHLSAIPQPRRNLADFQVGLDAYNRGNYETALKEFRPLAEKDHGEAQYKLGVMYDRGWGVPQDYAEAITWYQRSAEQGYVKAQHNLGSMYEKGQEVPQDYQEAVRWYRLAAMQGNAKAQFDPGGMYYEGKGVLQGLRVGPCMGQPCRRAGL